MVAGSQQVLAGRIGVTQAFISQWVTGRRPVPAERCVAVERATDEKVTRYELRPDVFGDQPVATALAEEIGSGKPLRVGGVI